MRVEWYDALLTDDDGQTMGLLCTGLDVTERRVLEREVLEIAADEQRRIGQELHDGTQQQLMGLGLLSQSVADSLEALYQTGSLHGDPHRLEELLRRARQIQHGLKQASGDVNQLARGLIPVEIDGEGLRSSLTELADQVTQYHNIDCDFSVEGQVNVADNFVATHIFRIAQEAVNNVVKHSGASRIEISLKGANTFLTLKVVDNGRGMHDEQQTVEGRGLRIMAYRSDLIGAVLRIDNVDSGGTEVQCQLRQ